MWHLKLVPKLASKKMPLLSNILNFLLIAFNFMLNHLKTFYNPRVSITQMTKHSLNLVRYARCQTSIYVKEGVGIAQRSLLT